MNTMTYNFAKYSSVKYPVRAGMLSPVYTTSPAILLPKTSLSTPPACVLSIPTDIAIDWLFYKKGFDYWENKQIERNSRTNDDYIQQIYHRQ